MDAIDAANRPVDQGGMAAGMFAHVLGESDVEGIGDLRFRTVVRLKPTMN
jgi:hypothetical protein